MQAIVIMIVGVLIGAKLSDNPLGWLGGLLLVAGYGLGFSGIAIAVASKTDSPGGYHMLIFMLNLPLLFLSNALYPLQTMPTWMEVAARLNPTTYVVTGMRMGLADEFKIVRTVEKLNRVFHETSLSSKFVSLFYGEIERNGNFIYCNAGHVPTLHLHDDQFAVLRKGGPVLGPSPDVRYARGYVLMQKDDILVFYTDGITEAHDANEDEFGRERLMQAVKENRQAGARELVQIIFDAVEKFAPDDPLRDDQTVVIVKRLTHPDVT